MATMTATNPLLARRLEVGLSRKELAQRAQCSVSTVQLVEQDWSGATDATVRRIRIALGMKP